MNITFAPATKQQVKLRLAIAGPSGSGKTYTALSIASGIGKRIAVVDTEHGSASRYADLFSFDVLQLAAPFHPDRFREAIAAAAGAGYDVVVIDSLSHAWNGTGGVLEIVDEFAAKRKTGNSFAVWKDVTPIHNRLVESMIAAPLHLIATMRSKQDYVQEQDGKGRTQIRKVGMAPIQRDGMEYEFDLFVEMDMENRALVQKSRCPALSGKVIEKPGADVARVLLDWLDGAPPAATAAPQAQEFTTDPDTVQSLNIAGREAYGAGWDEKRRELVRAVTKGRTESSKALSPTEAAKLIAGIKAQANGTPAHADA